MCVANSFIASILSNSDDVNAASTKFPCLLASVVLHHRRPTFLSTSSLHIVMPVHLTSVDGFTSCVFFFFSGMSLEQSTRMFRHGDIALHEPHYTRRTLALRLKGQVPTGLVGVCSVGACSGWLDCCWLARFEVAWFGLDRREFARLKLSRRFNDPRSSLQTPPRGPWVSPLQLCTEGCRVPRIGAAPKNEDFSGTSPFILCSCDRTSSSFSWNYRSF